MEMAIDQSYKGDSFSELKKEQKTAVLDTVLEKQKEQRKTSSQSETQ